MTEKRFILVEYVNKGLFIQDDANDETQYFQGSKASLEKVVDLLNALHDENEQLKKDKFICLDCEHSGYVEIGCLCEYNDHWQDWINKCENFKELQKYD